MRITHVLAAVIVVGSRIALAQMQLEPQLQTRSAHAIAFDAAGSRTLLYGGASTAGVLGDVWAHDGNSWQRQPSSGGPQLRDHGMAVVDGGGKSGALLLVGGCHGNGAFATGANGSVAATWLWRDGEWFDLSAAGDPQPRRSALVAHDPLRNRLVMHGGVTPSGAWLDETWTWSQQDGWQQFQGAVPANARTGIAWNAATGRIAVVQRTTAWPLSLAVHEFDGAQWTQTGWLDPFYDFVDGFAVATAPQQAGLALFGGLSFSGLANNSLCRWNAGATTWVLTGPNAPSPRFDARMTLDAARQRLVVQGGWFDATFALARANDTWEWDGSNWLFSNTASYPEFRDDAGLVATPGRGGLLLESGYSQLGTGLRNDSWSWNQGAWTRLGPGLAQAGNAITYDPLRDRVVRFDGITTWEHDGISWLPRGNGLPRPNGRGPMAFDPRTGRCVLFDGQTWEWDGTAWTPVASAATLPHGGGGIWGGEGLAFDSVRQELVLVTYDAGTWAYVGGTWQQRGPSPFAPGGALVTLTGVTYDAGRDRVLALGNQFATLGSQQVPVLFQWNGNAWDQGTSIGQPLQSMRPALAWSPDLQASLLVGGSDTWLLVSQNPASLRPMPAACTSPAVGVPVLGGGGSAPWIGDTLQLSLTGLAGTAAAAIGVIGVDATEWNGLPLPLPLGGIGMTDCELQVRIDAITGLGGPQWSIPVPNLPSLVGSRAYCQALVLAPGANPLGALASNGVELGIGRR